MEAEEFSVVLTGAKFAAEESIRGMKEMMYCGFAWVNVYGVRKGSKFSKVLEANGFRHVAYAKAHQYWVSLGGQSMDVKETYASAMAKALSAAGLRAFAESRAD